MKTQKSGWAVIRSDSKDILVDTVSKTRRAAIVNYLVAYTGRFISAAMSDEKINSLWSMHKEDVFVHEVTIEIDLP